jgi:predicted NBD/HSP70 family sugar kinase
VPRPRRIVASRPTPTPPPAAPTEMSLLKPLTSAELVRSVADEHGSHAPTLTATIWLDGPTQGCCVQPVFPLPTNAHAEQRIARYVASEANNLAVTRGGVRLHIKCPREVPGAKVLESIERHYPQLHQLLDSSARITASAEPAVWGNRNAPAKDNAREILPLPHDRLAVGINVGQTDTKVVVATGAGISNGMCWCMPTFPVELPRGRGLAARVARVAEVAVSAAGGTVEDVGLALGGIIRKGAIDRRSGVTLRLGDADYEALVALPDMLRERFGVGVSLVQDVEAKAYFHAVSGGAHDCLVLDLGTSLGGAYIDANGAVPPYLNQVGRIAFDLDEASVPRADGRGDGLLSQYLSARGIVSLAAAVGTAITDAAQLECLSIAPSRPSERRLLELLRSRIEAGVSLAAKWYVPEKIMLTGGVVRGRFGAVAQTWLEELGDYEVALSGEPLFDGCIGAAWIALGEATL